MFTKVVRNHLLQAKLFASGPPGVQPPVVILSTRSGTAGTSAPRCTTANELNKQKCLLHSLFFLLKQFSVFGISLVNGTVTIDYVAVWEMPTTQTTMSDKRVMNKINQEHENSSIRTTSARANCEQTSIISLSKKMSSRISAKTAQTCNPKVWDAERRKVRIVEIIGWSRK